MKSVSRIAPTPLWELWNKVRETYIIFTRRNKPVAYLLCARQFDEEDIHYMTDPAFWNMIAKNRESDVGVPLEEIKKELQAGEKRESSGFTLPQMTSRLAQRLRRERRQMGHSRSHKKGK